MHAFRVLSVGGMRDAILFVSPCVHSSRIRPRDSCAFPLLEAAYFSRNLRTVSRNGTTEMGLEM